jgi:hypothetical protein
MKSTKGAKRSNKSHKRGRVATWRSQRVVVTTSCDEGANDNEADDADEELIAATEHDFKRQPQQPTNQFEKLVKATYPNHTYPIRHKLKECTMMKNYMTTKTFSRVRKLKDDPTRKDVPQSPKRRRSCQFMKGHHPTSPGASSNLLVGQSML